MCARPLSAAEAALAMLLQKCQEQTEITLTNANVTLPRRLGFRLNVAGVYRLFRLAESHGAGVLEGTSERPRLRLTLATMPPA